MQEKYKRQYKYIKKNKEKYASYSLKYYYLNKEKAALKAKNWRIKNKEYIRTKQREDKRKRKEFAIQYLGGKCFICKEKFHPACFEFHHINPEEKDRDPSKMLSLSLTKLKNELDKCLLLCANCHRLEHHGKGYEWKENISKQASQKTSLNSNTQSVPMILGEPAPKELWKMSVELDGEPNIDYLVKMIADNLKNTLKDRNFCQEADTSFMLEDHSVIGITVTYSGQKKTPEKNGQT